MPDKPFWQRYASPLSLTRLMDLMPVETSIDEDQFPIMSHEANHSMPPNGTGFLGDFGQTVGAVLGVAPFVGEPRHSFWKRNMPNIMPPSLQEPQGRDIELPPAEVAVRKALSRR